MMRDTIVTALLTVGLAACSSKSVATGRGTGGPLGSGGTLASADAQDFGGVTSSSGAPGTGGRSGGGGTMDTGAVTSASGAGGTSGSSGTKGSAGATSPGGTSGGAGVTSSAGTAGGGGGSSAGGATASGAGGGTAAQPGSGGTGGTTARPDAGPDRDATLTSKDAAEDVAAGDSAPQRCSASQPAPKAGDQTVTMQNGGRSRSYILHAPSGVTTGTALPVVIDLHGAGGNGKQQQGMSGFNSLADKQKFLAVFPDGVDGYWNVDDTCCGTAGKEKIDDVGFLKAIISQLSAQTCIDAKRIYVTGFSNGGGLAHRMGCDAADLIAAIAPTATDLRTQPCNAARAISMMEVKGIADSVEPYDGGVVGPSGGQYTDVGAKQSLKLWADIDRCAGTTTTIDQYCESYTQCADGVEADLCSLPNTDHSTYGNSLGFNVASVIWTMFERQPMK